MCDSNTSTEPRAEEAPSCSCCPGGDSVQAETTGAAMGTVEASYSVTGMTCGHCAEAVKEELTALVGVSSVQVDVVSGGASTVRVASSEPLSDGQVRTALAEAGDYALVGSS